MQNAEIVDVLLDIAYLLGCRKESWFKIMAYRKAAQSIQELTANVEQLARENRLREIPGVGDAINNKITELVNTGHLEYYERLKAEQAEVKDDTT